MQSILNWKDNRSFYLSAKVQISRNISWCGIDSSNFFSEMYKPQGILMLQSNVFYQLWLTFDSPLETFSKIQGWSLKKLGSYLGKRENKDGFQAGILHILTKSDPRYEGSSIWHHTGREGWRVTRDRVAVWVPASLFSWCLNLLQLVLERYSFSTEGPGALNDSQQ